MSYRQLESEQPSKDKDKLIDLHSQYTDAALEVINSRQITMCTRPKMESGLGSREKSVKSIILKRTHSDIIKKNILKSRYSRRKEELKELTQNNIQMFMRIKAQQSHYSLKTIRPIVSRQTLAHLSRPKSTIPEDGHQNSHKTVRVRCKSAKLISRCSALKDGITQEKREDSSTRFTVYTDRDKNELESKRNIVSRSEMTCNKENQGNNRQQFRMIQKQQLNKDLQRRMVAKKLGFLPKRDAQPLKARAKENQRLLLQTETVLNQLKPEMPSNYASSTTAKEGLAQRPLNENLS